MTKYAVVNSSNNIVSNMIIVEDLDVFEPPENSFLIDIENFRGVKIGSTYDPVVIDFIPPIIEKIFNDESDQ